MVATLKRKPARRRRLPQSIRWRLPLSYAGIALLATVALGLILLVLLLAYYRGREDVYLVTNARSVSTRLAPLVADQSSPEALQAQVEGFAFLLQRRVRLLDNSGHVLADSGSPTELAIDLIPRQQAAGLSAPAAPAQPSVSGDTTYLTYIGVKHQPPAASRSAARVPYAQRIPPIPAVPPIPPAPATPLPGASEAQRARYQADLSAYEAKLHERDARIQELLTRREARIQSVMDVPVEDTLYGFNVDPDVAQSGPRSDRVGTSVLVAPNTTQLLGYVELSQGPSYGDEIVTLVAVVWALATLIATLLAASVGWLASRQLTAPLFALAGATARMAAGDLAARAEVRGQDEFSLLARSFNEMAGRIEQIVGTLRRFVADAAHEINTPLTALRANLDLALEETRPAEHARFVELACADAERLENLANDLLDLSRVESAPEQGVLQPIELSALVRDLSEVYSAQAEQAGLRLCLDLPPDELAIVGSDVQVRRAIGNLVENAIKFTPAGGAITISATKSPARAQTRKGGGAAVLLTVGDTGIGIPAEDLPMLFSRFHRGRNAAAYPGSGLGLAIVKAIMQRHGGEVTVSSSPAGTRFTLRWPAAPSGDRAAGRARAREQPARPSL
ncbi:MAG: HAMP domain-containing histidine kinase [Kouleothrix sp.]|nr:HAMP domain-containing histidine kinase [Kouleothrix sp.]